MLQRARVPRILRERCKSRLVLGNGVARRLAVPAIWGKRREQMIRVHLDMESNVHMGASMLSLITFFELPRGVLVRLTGDCLSLRNTEALGGLDVIIPRMFEGLV